MTPLYILLLFGPIALADDKEKLISVIAIFRHGDRAPTDRLSNKTYLSSFPNGLGELSDRGIENSYRLGTFLRDRYVNNGFLRKPVLPSQVSRKLFDTPMVAIGFLRQRLTILIRELHSQVYFRSKGNNRCLMSASLVASAMFSVYGRPTTSAVPIYSQEGKDPLLGGTIDCDAEVKRIVAKCGRPPKKSYANFTEFEGMIYECLQLNKKSKLFPTGKSFELVDSLINEYYNGLPVPKWFEDHANEIIDDFIKVENFILGVGEYHDPDILRVKSGLLLNSTLYTLKSNWEQFVANGSLEKRKFVAYSTQDWLIQAFMESLGIREAAIGDGYPPYSSLLIFELRKIKDLPVVKVFYRDPHTSLLADVTKSVRGCKQCDACPLELLLSCCPQYTTADKEKECYHKESRSR
ncbi:hypothetical protein Y032_0009g434 [Ancylostoma ceylanicum]|uniref:Histidine acid phosphatase n=1 Tax=Ancylostoma ceylanicum TaxID=53326 RepID=A0A016VHN6_9BILA|nr:hypothetical protein Y032_0009g434 [Ancylostoma ceylanicum]